MQGRAFIFEGVKRREEGGGSLRERRYRYRYAKREDIGGGGGQRRGREGRVGEAKCFLASSRRFAFREGDP